MDKINESVGNMNMNAAPVFWNVDSGKWYFTEKRGNNKKTKKDRQK